MLRYITPFLFIFIFSLNAAAQKNDAKAIRWVDSVMRTLTKEQRIAQLMVVRLSQIDPKTKQVVFFDDKVSGLITKYDIGKSEPLVTHFFTHEGTYILWR